MKHLSLLLELVVLGGAAVKLNQKIKSNCNKIDYDLITSALNSYDYIHISSQELETTLDQIIHYNDLRLPQDQIKVWYVNNPVGKQFCVDKEKQKYVEIF